ncbi:MAG: glycosyltransferase family A protein, partial [Oscillospiraceae bacterium]
MKLWYFCPLSEDDEGFGTAVQNAVRRYAAHFSLTILFPDKTLKSTTTGHYCMQSFISGNSIVRGFVAEEFALSYEAQLAVRDTANLQKLPDVIVFPEKDAFAYYTVLYSYIDSEYYKQCRIFIEPSAKAADDFPKYLLPYWWIAQLSAFCLENSRGAVPVNSDEFVQMINSTQGADFAPNVFPLLTKRVQTPPAVAPNKAGLLTVIIPFYNLGNSLSETLESAFNSDYPSLEIILIDDGSTDADSLRVLESEQLKYPSLQVIHQKNQGLSAVRNLGAALAKGEFITYLDADDMVMPKYYSRCISLLQQYNNIGYVGSWLQLFGESNDIVPYFQSSLPALLLYNSQASFCVSRKDVYSTFGQNKESMCAGFEDHDAWLSLAENGWFGI